MAEVLIDAETRHVYMLVDQYKYMKKTSPDAGSYPNYLNKDLTWNGAYAFCQTFGKGFELPSDQQPTGV